MQDRKANEQSFHDERFKGEVDTRASVAKYYSINEGTRERYDKIISSLCRNKRLLELGCGTGENSMSFLRHGARVTGIDISPEGIKKAEQAFQDTDHNVDYFVMDCERMSFADGAFDIVVGGGIIHHLNLDRTYPEINRILTDDGHAVFIEPLGHNPVINVFRRLTPALRTVDEHPLKVSDLNELLKYFERVETEYYSLFTLLAVPLRQTFLFASMCRFLGRADSLAFKIPFLRKYAWTVVIHALNPRRGVNFSSVS